MKGVAKMKEKGKYFGIEGQSTQVRTGPESRTHGFRLLCNGDTGTEEAKIRRKNTEVRGKDWK